MVKTIIQHPLREGSLLKFIARLIVLFCLVLCLVPFSFAQNNGTTGTFTMSQQLTFDGSGNSQVVRNIGQSAHYLQFCTAGWSGFPQTIAIQSSFNGTTNWTTIAETAVALTGCRTLQAGGYYQAIRVHAFSLGGTITAVYNASSGPISFAATGISSTGATPPTICDQNISVSIANGATGLVVGEFPDGTAVFKICGFQISFNGATAAGSYQFETASDSACTGPNGPIWPNFTTAATPQTITAGSGQGTLFTVPGLVLCFLNNSGATARVNISYAGIVGSF